MKYDQIYDGDKGIWTRIAKIRCCDCGLVHLYKFKKAVEVQVWRDNRATAASRRSKKYKARVK